MPISQSEDGNRLHCWLSIGPGDILVQCLYKNKRRELIEVLSTKPKHDGENSSIPCITIHWFSIRLIDLDLYRWGLKTSPEGLFVDFAWLERPTGWEKLWWKVYKFFSRPFNPPLEGYPDECTIIK